MSIIINNKPVGRPLSPATKYSRAVQALAANGSPFQGAMLAAAILCVADQNTLEERVDNQPHEENGVGFSRKTAKAGLTAARWVRGGTEKRVSFAGETFTFDPANWKVAAISEPNEAGVREALLVAVAKPISPGFHTKRALDVVNTHSKQCGRLEVAAGLLTKAMAEVETLHGVSGLREAFAVAVAAQEKVVVEEVVAQPSAKASRQEVFVFTQPKAKPKAEPVKKLIWHSC